MGTLDDRTVWVDRTPVYGRRFQSEPGHPDLAQADKEIVRTE
jgi:hypothetical protein